ncbi:MAG: DUF484 family protein [Methylococcales bacterium]
MKPVTLRTEESNGVSAEQVRTYLANHPDFFVRHEKLLESLVVPHSSFRGGNDRAARDRQLR